MGGSERHTAMEFIRLWQTSPSLAEACKALGLSRATASARAHRMRTYGVPLKSFVADTRWVEMAEYARKLAEGE